MSEDELEEVAANLGVLIREEMEVQHRLGEHRVPVPDCPFCRARPGWAAASAQVAAVHDP
ncbi:MAG: hypothetical protein M3203_08170 [Actinomycetota bacterium]|nr:hypothetical protein [Actinomycetota bacterium]